VSVPWSTALGTLQHPRALIWLGTFGPTLLMTNHDTTTTLLRLMMLLLLDLACIHADYVTHQTTFIQPEVISQNISTNLTLRHNAHQTERTPSSSDPRFRHHATSTTVGHKHCPSSTTWTSNRPPFESHHGLILEDQRERLTLRNMLWSCNWLATLTPPWTFLIRIQFHLPTRHKA